MLGRGNTSRTAISHASELREHVDKSFPVRSKFVGYPDFLAPAMQKAFYVLVLYVDVLLHLLGPVDGGLL